MIAATVPYGNGLVVSTTGEIIAGVLTAAILGSVGYLIRQSKQRAKDDAQRTKDIADIKGALITPEPTKLEPNPSPRLVEVVMGRDGKSGLVGQVAEHGRILHDIVNRQDIAKQIASEVNKQ
jgi:hypothetical protein